MASGHRAQGETLTEAEERIRREEALRTARDAAQQARQVQRENQQQNAQVAEQAGEVAELAEQIVQQLEGAGNGQVPNQQDVNQIQNSAENLLQKLSAEQQEEYRKLQSEAEEADKEVQRLEAEAEAEQRKANELSKQIKNTKNAEQKAKLVADTKKVADETSTTLQRMEAAKNKLKHARSKERLSIEIQSIATEIQTVLSKINSNANISTANTDKLKGLQGRITELEKEIEAIEIVSANNPNRNKFKTEMAKKVTAKNSLKKLHTDIIKNITNYTKTVNTIKKELNDITIVNSASNTLTLKQGKNETLLDNESALLQLQINLQNLINKITTNINQNTTLKPNNKTSTKTLSINPLKQLSENVNKLINKVEQLKKKPNQNSVANLESIQVQMNENRLKNVQFDSMENILRKQGIGKNNNVKAPLLPQLKRQNTMKPINVGPASASAAIPALVQNKNVGPLAASAAYALGLNDSQPVRQNASVTEPRKGLNNNTRKMARNKATEQMQNVLAKAKANQAKQQPVKPENVKPEFKPNATRKASATKVNITNSTINATIIWKGSYMDLTMNENKDCNEITQYLDANKTSAFIYKMNKAEVEKATKNKGKEEWIAVVCYLASDGKQVNMPITKTTLLRTDLYDVLQRKNKQITTITSSTMRGGKNRTRSVKNNKRSTRRNRRYRK